jgi:hypothetical protein
VLPIQWFMSAFDVALIVLLVALIVGVVARAMDGSRHRAAEWDRESEPSDPVR